MFKTKLLILLLSSCLYLSCAKKNLSDNNTKYSLGYVGGQYDGVVLYNLLKSHLNSNGMFDPNSNFKITASVTHSESIFITNIDNTSDREKITSEINMSIINEKLVYKPYNFSDTISQFYIFSPNANFTSNDRAKLGIKFDNTDAVVKKFINDIIYKKPNCEKDK